ncbi:hypothetical protein CONCODRAFT_16189 [Conidiobolus coronatus NRRL 28638]|uniref:Non-structural maintenance of chromosomes element 1 homolog n=1 Tax=Conidiobolus coronatus (strain ATCC 28846 / CBS 209.66 / NRRL 28638) TaxID=796925 RepID=A0A137PBT8_CONC2|nr:hypothetical protein CONCODRAFT_16189 [Conidiobolus coronatus NRRL 28638]|eukprot:KXN72443.1 hypothetical protein CONCODRAFT_16189 [Conidiobolus coronatus NRRL 28638]
MELNQSHHLFIQKLLNGRVVDGLDIKSLMEGIIECYPSEFDLTEEDTQYSQIELIFPQFLNKINSHLFSLDLEIRKGLNQTNGEIFYHLINLNPDEFSQLATNYSALELGYLKNLIESIITSSHLEFSIKMSSALRDVPLHTTSALSQQDNQVPQSQSAGSNLTKLERQQLIDRFIQDDWLYTLEGTGLLTVSDRCLNELRDKLINEFEEDIWQCKLCMNLVTQGYLCKSPNCNTYYHHPCLDKLLKDIEDNRTSLSDRGFQVKCLSCHNELKTKLVGHRDLCQFNQIYLDFNTSSQTLN